jgi:hypothetical protein
VRVRCAALSVAHNCGQALYTIAKCFTAGALFTKLVVERGALLPELVFERRALCAELVREGRVTPTLLDELLLHRCSCSVVLVGFFCATKDLEKPAFELIDSPALRGELFSEESVLDFGAALARPCRFLLQ